MAKHGRFLVVTWAGGGHLSPTLVIADELRRRGHEVLFLGHEAQRSALKAAGFAFTAYERSPAIDLAAPITWAPTIARDVFMPSAMAADVCAEAGRLRPQVLLVDGLLSGALAGAEQCGVPTAVLVPTLPGHLLNNPTGERALAREQRYTELRRTMRAALGLEPVDSWGEEWSRSRLTLVAVLESLAGVGEELPSNARFVGPILPALPVSDAWEPSWPPEDTRPLVLISFSTNYHEQSAPTIQRVLDALAGEVVRIMVTTGPAMDPDALAGPANAVIERFVPHELLLAHASLVITHGGHGTTMAALAHGLPVLILPTFGDQPFMAEQITCAGAGLSLPLDACDGAIQTAVRKLLTEPAYRAAAGTLAAQIAASGGAIQAATLLEDLLADGQEFEQCQ